MLDYSGQSHDQLVAGRGYELEDSGVDKREGYAHLQRTAVKHQDLTVRMNIHFPHELT
jgi:hypothetical protein